MSPCLVEVPVGRTCVSGAKVARSPSVPCSVKTKAGEAWTGQRSLPGWEPGLFRARASLQSQARRQGIGGLVLVPSLPLRDEEEPQLPLL